MRTSQRVLLLVIVLAGLLLRFGGLSHDLDRGGIYHPDTPKQMRAADRFLHGDYYRHTGLSDYDGYPYFTSHAVACLGRAGSWIARGMLSLMGIPHGPMLPNVMAFYWITLVFNATLSTLLILVLFQIGRENFSLAAAYMAAVFLAFSPLDITACHYATGDTAAGFFGTLAVFAAFRVYRHGRCRDYVAAAVCVAFGFAAKYHAGVAILPVLTAHVFRMRSWRELFGRASLLRLGVLALAGVVALFLAIPALFEHPVAAIRDMHNFVTNAMVREPASLKAAGPLAKFGVSMQRNVPVLVDVVGPAVVAAALLSLWEVFRLSPGMVTLSMLPLVYFFVGVTSRPLAMPVYHTLMTPSLFLMASVFLARLWAGGIRRRRIVAGVAGLVAVASAGYLLHYSLREVFFFRHHDVRRMAKAWARENIPTSFETIRGRYSISLKRKEEPGRGPAGSIAVNSTFDPRDPPDGYFPFKTFSLEPGRGLAFFRNPTIDIFMEPSPDIREGFSMPVFQRIPSKTESPFIFDNGPEFYRSQKLFILEGATSVVRRLVRSKPLDEAVIVIQNGAIPNLVEVSFGGTCRRFTLAAGGGTWLTVVKPRAGFPSQPGHLLYRFAARSSYGRVRIALATTALEKGTYLYNLGQNGDAACLYLCDALRAFESPTVAVQACTAPQRASTLAAQSVTRLAEKTGQVKNADSLRETYGISTDYLDALDYLSMQAEEMKRIGFRKVRDLAAAGEMGVEPDPAVPFEIRSLTSAPLMLEPGMYRVGLKARRTGSAKAAGNLEVAVLDALGRERALTMLAVGSRGPKDYGDLNASIEVPPGLPECRIAIKPDSDFGVVIDEVRLSPDPVQGVKALAKRYRGEKPVNETPMAKEQAQPVDVRFGGGVRLVEFGVREDRVARGRPLGLKLCWGLERRGIPLGKLVVFVHFLDDKGQVRFQGDRELADFLPLRPGAADFCDLAIPADAAPGEYSIRLGLYRPDTRKRVKIVSSNLPVSEKSFLLPRRIEVSASP